MNRRQSHKQQRVEVIRHHEVFALLQEARALGKSQRSREAAEIYRKVLELEPENPRALLGLSDIFYHAGDHQEAARYLESYLSVSPPTEYALYCLGNINRARSREKQAFH